VISHTAGSHTELWAAIIGRMIGWGLIAAAPFARGRAKHRRASLGNGLVISVATLITVWGLSRSLGVALPNLDPTFDRTVPASLNGALAAQAMLFLLAVVGFSNRFRLKGEDLDYWLALGSTLMLFASLHFMFTPLVQAGEIQDRLGHGLDLILDGGITLNEPSTVIDLTGPRPLVLRQGKGRTEGVLA